MVDQNQALATNTVKKPHFYASESYKCCSYGSRVEKITHIVSETFAQYEYKAYHDKVNQCVHQSPCNRYGLDVIESSFENNSIKFAWDLNARSYSYPPSQTSSYKGKTHRRLRPMTKKEVQKIPTTLN